MRIRHRGREPEVDSSAFIAPTATLVGNVWVGPNTRILYGAVLDAEGSSIHIGATCILSENVVLRATASGSEAAPVRLGDHVLVGPHATLLGCSIESCAFIATGATVLQGARVESGGVVGVGALVHAETRIPKDVFVPPNAIAIGDPARMFSPEDGDALLRAIKALKFSRRAFGVDVSSGDRAAIYRAVTDVRSREYAAHFDDLILEEGQDDDR